MTSPKPVFQPVNGRKPPSKTQQEISPLHGDLIRYLGDSWNRVSRDLQTAQEEAANGKTGPPRVVVWERKPDSEPKDFTPFDLEGWWGTRLYQNLTQAV